MPELADRMPLINVTAADVRARVDADANAGLDPDDSRFIDTTEGGFYWDITQPLILEITRLWDFAASEVPASIYVATSWGENLDDHGETIDVPRKDQSYATGEVTFTGEDGTIIAIGTQIGTPQTDPEEEPPSFVTTAAGTITEGAVVLAVKAVEPGGASNVGAGAASILLSPAEGIESVENIEALTGGADVETDEAYRARLLIEFGAAQGAGNVADYKRWALAYEGVGFVRVVPLWNGPGTVLVVVTDGENNPVSLTVTEGLQAELDPVPGEGEGKAPIGAEVTVSTPTSVTVAVEAEGLELEPGYSLDGASGTVAVRESLEQALSEYIDRLAPGEDVLLNKAESRFFLVEGLRNLGTLKLAGSSANKTITDEQVASMGVVTLSE